MLFKNVNVKNERSTLHCVHVDLLTNLKTKPEKIKNCSSQLVLNY